MSRHANQCRREAILARHQAAQIEAAAKRLLQDAARNWEVLEVLAEHAEWLAEHAEWLEQKLRSLSELQAMPSRYRFSGKGPQLKGQGTRPSAPTPLSPAGECRLHRTQFSRRKR
jgi:hypothetical protein